MGYTNDNIKKFCNFYVSDWHLAVMLLPYINREINEGVKITTILEKDMKNNIETLIGRLNLKNEDEILNINWNDNNNNIEKYIQNNLDDKKQNLFIINGNKDYIENTNEKLFNCIKEKGVQRKFIKIVDCYEIGKDDEKMYDIIKMHDGILNTSGEYEIKKTV
ncbi:MAG: hypothetical protein HFJ20_06200 [Clostridia bacterium]|nr:hypothetical protein [Clostridia bacterium]